MSKKQNILDDMIREELKEIAHQQMQLIKQVEKAMQQIAKLPAIKTEEFLRQAKKGE